jgi:hypothetical protein
MHEKLKDIELVTSIFERIIANPTLTQKFVYLE